MVTIKDVAREANVAISTVSNVINNVDNVSAETKKRVLDAVEKLHYVPNFNARSLKTNKKNTIRLTESQLRDIVKKKNVQMAFCPNCGKRVEPIASKRTGGLCADCFTESLNLLDDNGETGEAD